MTPPRTFGRPCWKRGIASDPSTVCSPVSDESARGAALAGLVRLGHSLPPLPADEETVEPDRARADAFAELRASQPDPPFAASLGP